MSPIVGKQLNPGQLDSTIALACTIVEGAAQGIPVPVLSDEQIYALAFAVGTLAQYQKLGSPILADPS